MRQDHILVFRFFQQYSARDMPRYPEIHPRTLQPHENVPAMKDCSRIPDSLELVAVIDLLFIINART